MTRKTIKTLMAAALLLFTGSAMADDGITIADVTMKPGAEENVMVNFVLDNTDVTYYSLEFTVEKFADDCPLSVIANGEGFVCAPSETLKELGFTISSFPKRVNSEIVGYSFQILSMSSIALPYGTGELLSFKLYAEEGAEGTYPVKVTNVRMGAQDKMGDWKFVEAADLTFNVTISDRIVFDEMSTKLPTYTAGNKENVKMLRTIKAGEWSTLVLPFNLTKVNAAVFGTDAQFAKYSGFVVDYGEDETNLTPLGITINFTSYTIPARGNLAAGTPVLIKTSTDISEFELDGVTLGDKVTDQSIPDELGTAGKFTGSLVKTVVPADGLFLSGNKFWYSTGKTNIKAFRGWFELGAVLDKDTDFGANVSFVVDGELTSIDGVPSYVPTTDGIYNLQGQRMEGSFESLPQGIYIMNGKKVVRR